MSAKKMVSKLQETVWIQMHPGFLTSITIFVMLTQPCQRILFCMVLLVYELYVTCCNFFLAGHTLQTVSTQHQQGVLLLWVPREEDRPYQAQKSQIRQNGLLWASVHSQQIFKRYVGHGCQNCFKLQMENAALLIILGCVHGTLKNAACPPNLVIQSARKIITLFVPTGKKWLSRDGASVKWPNLMVEL